MSKPSRQFSVEKKFAILQEAGQSGFTQTLIWHNLPHSVLLGWKNGFNSRVGEYLKLQYHKAAGFTAVKHTQEKGY